ncbi:hypothetical protein M3181_14950 [Mesobacillus maritimus]|uniref:hypothetical protein n=1 Tax=Mesobacillus maritimus TaxID=1643336 RepID=UPI002041AA17|nr:hypothetical protein [Mesobacillus maritimus]MCM3670279.1 hypothetical protein [Mesobacillus maritimus]
MMEPLKLLEYTEAIHHEIDLEGDKLRIFRRKYLPGDLKEQILHHKTGILEILQNDRAAKEIGLMVGIPGTLYMWTVSRFSTAYMELYNNEWIAWRETYQVGRRKAISHKIIAQGNKYDYVLMQFKKYIDYIKKRR